VYGYTQDKEDYLKRLRRIEGQVRGLQRMVEDDAGRHLPARLCLFTASAGGGPTL